MIINKKNYKICNAFISNDTAISFLMNLKDRTISFNLEDTYNNLGEYTIKFKNVLGYNMTPFDFLEKGLSVSDFYINLDVNKYSRQYDINLDNYLEVIIEFNNDDFIKVLCDRIEVDDKKGIMIAN